MVYSNKNKKGRRHHFGTSKIPIYQRKDENFEMKIEDDEKIRNLGSKTHHLLQFDVCNSTMKHVITCNYLISIRDICQHIIQSPLVTI